MNNNVYPIDKSVPINENLKGKTINDRSSFNEHDIIVLNKVFKDALEELKIVEKEVGAMAEYINKDNFKQFEKEVKRKFKKLDKKIDALPTSTDIKLMLLENNEALKKESRSNKNVIIGWMIAIVSLGLTAAKSFGLI